MKSLVRGVLERPVSVVVTIIALAVFFVTTLTSITLKLMPDMSIPVMAVMTIYPGASPEDVDELVSDKISSECETLSGLKTVMCQSSEGMSMVMMQYEYGKDMDKAYNDVRAKVDSIKSQFPSDAKDPTILEIDTNAIDDITLSVTGTSDDVDVLKEVNDHIVPELKKISNLAQTTVTGGDEKYIRVQVSPEYLSQYGLTLTGIAQAIGTANFSMPAGSAEYGEQAISLSAGVKYDTLPRIEQIPITTSKGQVIYLNDIASVKYAVSDKSSLSRYLGKDNVSIGIQRKQSASSVTLSRQVMPVLEELREKYPGLEIEVVEDMADTILDTLKGVAKTMVQAVLLAMLIIFIFFGDIKGSLIVGSTMPVSIMATIICMHMAGFSLDIITMAALIIAIGMMTDNAVVVIEMCFRKHQAGLSFKEAAYEGTSIVINSVIGSTLTTMIVYLPLSVMEGLSGQMFKPLGFTIIFALLASLISAITLIPLCFAAYKPVERREIITNRILRRIVRVYRKVLRFSLKWKKSIFLAAVVTLVFTGFLATFLQTELFSGTDEGIAQVTLEFRPNLDLDAMDDTVRAIEEYIGTKDYIENYSTSVTKASSTATISAFKSDDTKLTTQEIVDEWNTELRNFSDMCDVRVSSGSAMGTGGMSSPNTEEFDITSADLDGLKAKSKEILQIMKDTDGVLYATSDFSDTGAKAMVDIDPVLSQAKGFSARQIAGLVYANMEGSKGTEVTIDNKKYDVTVKYPEGYYETISDVESMTFTNAQGITVPLSEIGTVKFESAPQSVKRQDGLYVDQIIATMTAATRDEVAPELRKKIDAVMEGDREVTYLDSAEQRMMKEEFASLAKAIFIAIFMVFFVMAVQFESVVDSILIMMCVPFAGIGSILFLLIMNIKISMVSLMGVLMLSGIVVNNGIILIDMTIQNQKAGMDTVEALVDAGAGRLRPILMTTLTTVIAMVPVALGLSKDAMAMQGMAGVIVGGLSTSTVLTLVLLPTFYLLLDRARARITAIGDRRRQRQEQEVMKQEQHFHEKERENARVNLVFPMGGGGTRFLENGFECPKPLIELDGEPFFKRAADSLIGHLKYEKLVFVVLKEHVEKFEIDRRIKEVYPDARIVVIKKVLPGAVHTAMEGAKAARNGLPIIFTDCDLMFTSEEMYEFYRDGAPGADGSLLTFKSDKDRYSYVKVGEDGFAERTAEKEVISDRAITGAYGFANASMFLDMARKYLENCPYSEAYMSGVYNEMIRAGRKVKVFKTDEYMSFGTPDEYREAEKRLKKSETGEKDAKMEEAGEKDDDKIKSVVTDGNRAEASETGSSAPDEKKEENRAEAQEKAEDPQEAGFHDPDSGGQV